MRKFPGQIGENVNERRKREKLHGAVACGGDENRRADSQTLKDDLKMKISLCVFNIFIVLVIPAINSFPVERKRNRSRRDSNPPASQGVSNPAANQLRHGRTSIALSTVTRQFWVEGVIYSSLGISERFKGLHL